MTEQDTSTKDMEKRLAKAEKDVMDAGAIVVDALTQKYEAETMARRYRHQLRMVMMDVIAFMEAQDKAIVHGCDVVAIQACLRRNASHYREAIETLGESND